MDSISFQLIKRNKKLPELHAGLILCLFFADNQKQNLGTVKLAKVLGKGVIGLDSVAKADSQHQYKSFFDQAKAWHSSNPCW